MLDDVLRAILRLRETSLQASNNQIRFLMEEAQEANSDEINQYNYTHSSKCPNSAPHSQSTGLTEHESGQLTIVKGN